MILPVQILIQKPKAIAMSHLILIWMQEDIFKPPQSVFLGGMTKGTLCNDNAMSIHFDFLPFLYLINKYNHELEISRFFSQSRDFSKCNSRFRLQGLAGLYAPSHLGSQVCERSFGMPSQDCRPLNSHDLVV